MGKTAKKIAGWSLAGLAVTTLAGLVITGREIGWGPFRRLFKGFEEEVAGIEKKYPVSDHQHGILFYGASNFRLWTEMEQDLKELNVQNHGFGGSTDKLLVQYAHRLLYPYNPDIVVFQTGSNDYVAMSGTDVEKVAACMAYKRQMFETFHEALPNAKFVIMSGLLLPGRSRYTALTQTVNKELQALCSEKDYMYFVDASDMTYDGTSFAKELFVADGIHLNHDGQLRWRDEYILPQLQRLMDMFSLGHLYR